MNTDNITVSQEVLNDARGYIVGKPGIFAVVAARYGTAVAARMISIGNSWTLTLAS